MHIVSAIGRLSLVRVTHHANTMSIVHTYRGCLRRGWSTVIRALNKDGACCTKFQGSGLIVVFRSICPRIRKG